WLRISRTVKMTCPMRSSVKPVPRKNFTMAASDSAAAASSSSPSAMLRAWSGVICASMPIHAQSSFGDPSRMLTTDRALKPSPLSSRSAVCTASVSSTTSSSSSAAPSLPIRSMSRALCFLDTLLLLHRLRGYEPVFDEDRRAAARRLLHHFKPELRVGCLDHFFNDRQLLLADERAVADKKNLQLRVEREAH